MAYLPLALAFAALVVAWRASSRASSALRALEESSGDTRRQIRNIEDETERTSNVQRELLARVAEGERVTRDMVMEGQLFRDVDEAEAKELIANAEVMLIDIRTTAETAAGAIPGARLIPMDTLDDNLDKIPKQGPKLIYCAAGMRSAGVCDALAARGYQDLLNLEGGIGAWTGQLETT